MTETKYLNDSNTLNFTARLTGTLTDENGIWVSLDQTYFYPEGGGQPCDHGTIMGVPVLDVQYKEDEIYHLIESPLPPATDLPCAIDPDRRLDMMQQHTGQHLFSHGLEELFDAATIGFHLTESNLTVDTDQKLDQTAMSILEDYCNTLIRENLPVIVHYPSAAELAAMPLRKQPKVDENIRVIELFGKDFSPCGGTHLGSTGPIQLIKVKRLENYKTGTRIEFVCGGRALQDYREKNSLTLALTASLSVPHGELVEAVEKLKADTSEQRKIISSLREELLHLSLSDAVNQKIKKSFGDLVIFETTDLDPQLFRKASAKLTSQVKGVCVLINSSADTFNLIIAQSDDKPYPIQDLFQILKDTYGIKGGGNAVALQGGGTLNQLLSVKLFLLEQLK